MTDSSGRRAGSAGGRAKVAKVTTARAGTGGPLVIMPTYREAANIERAIRRVRTTVTSSSVLVVDDDGGDGTADLAEEAGRALGRVEVLAPARAKPASPGLPGRL